jgi:hypothetical protein
LLGLEGVEKLPAIQWKLANIRKMNTRKHAEMLAKLREVLDLKVAQAQTVSSFPFRSKSSSFPV